MIPVLISLGLATGLLALAGRPAPQPIRVRVEPAAQPRTPRDADGGTAS